MPREDARFHDPLTGREQQSGGDKRPRYSGSALPARLSRAHAQDGGAVRSFVKLSGTSLRTAKRAAAAAWVRGEAGDRREAEARRAAKALKESKEEMLPIIDTWAEAKRPEMFFADAEGQVQDLSSERRERN